MDELPNINELDENLLLKFVRLKTQELIQENKESQEKNQNQEPSKFDSHRLSFFTLIGDVFQLLVDKLHTYEFKDFEKSMAEAWGVIEVRKLIMDSQRPIIQNGEITRMNISTCYAFLQYICDLKPPDHEVWKDHNICGSSLESLITVLLCQLIAVVYSKDDFDEVHQKECWDKLFKVLADFHRADFESDLLQYLHCWVARKENVECHDQIGTNHEVIHLSEYMNALDFIVVREIIEELRTFKSGFLHFCPNKLFSKFKIGQLNTDQLILYSNVFDWKDTDGQFPQIYVICGQRAAGKSCYMKYVNQQFGSDSSSFIGIDRFDLVIFIDSSNNSSHCLEEYIFSYLQNTTKKLKLRPAEIQEIMLHGNLLVMMDSFDVATSETHQLLKELTTFYTNNISLMIATRSDSLDNLSETLSKSKKTVILYPEANISVTVNNKDQEQRIVTEGATASCTVSIDIPPGYETSDVSKSKYLDAIQLEKEFSGVETVTINDENPRDKKKPSPRIIKNAVIKANNLIECLNTATAQLSNYESEEGRRQLQELLDEYEELYNDADILNRKLPHGMRTDLYKSGESIFCGITYWVQRICREPGITNEIYDKMESNYSKVKNHLHPKPEVNIDADCEKPTLQLVMANQRTLSDLITRARESVKMIESNEGRTDQETKFMLRELVIEIRNLRERCDSFNASLSKVERLNYLLYNDNVNLFTGLNYFFYKLTSAMDSGSAYMIAEGLVQELDEADEKIRNHLLNPEPIKPKLAKSWKSETIPTNENKKKGKKTKVKKKNKTGW